MGVTFKPFTSIGEIKEKAEFIPKGRILPARIVKAVKRKNQCRITARSNHYAIPTMSGYLVFVENNDGQFEEVLRVNCLSGTFQGSPYGGGTTLWLGNNLLREDQFLPIFNENYLSMNSRTVPVS